MKTVFFCGHNSPYGLGHLEPILKNFDVEAVVVATEQRWKQFQYRLSGGDFPCPFESSVAGASVMRMANGFRRKVAKWIHGDAGVQAICRSAGVPVWRVDNVNSPGFVHQLSQRSPHLILCAAYPQMFSRNLLETTTQGGINFHPALLPRNRGSHPHFWAIVSGDETGGISAHMMTESLDGGPIVAQTRFAILHMYYSEYYRAILDRTPALVAEVRSRLENGSPPVPQQGCGSFFRNDREIHHRIFWNLMDATSIRNLIRTEQAFCTYRDRLVFMRRAEITACNRNVTNNLVVEPGVIVEVTPSHVVIAAKGGYVCVSSLSEGVRNVSLARWLARHRPRIGERFH